MRLWSFNTDDKSDSIFIFIQVFSSGLRLMHCLDSFNEYQRSDQSIRCCINLLSPTPLFLPTQGIRNLF